MKKSYWRNHKREQRIKDELGMPHGTATNKLRKQIMFFLVRETNRDNCFKCGQRIIEIDDFTIEHKKIWEGVDPKLFWDINNIAFSHKQCNKTERTTRKIGPEGTAWCYLCKSFLHNAQFDIDRQRPNGFSNKCKSCLSKKRKMAPSSNG